MTRARRGEYFVVGWWTTYFVAALIANHTTRYSIPEGLLSLCLQVTAIFFGTLASQQVFKGRIAKVVRSPSRSARGLDEQEELVLQKVATSSVPVQRRDLEQSTGHSRSALQRILDSLTDKNLVEWTGQSPTDPNGGFRATTKSG